MIRNYLKTAWRSFRRDPGYSFINVAGLTIGMTCALLIGLYLWDELRYDDYHQEKNLYRVGLHRTFSGNDTYWATSPAPLAEVMVKEYPEVKEATRLYKIFGEVRVKQDDDIYFEREVLAADSNFFNLFSINMVRGNAKEALRLRNSAVLTRSTAIKYFGTDDVLGQATLHFL